MFDQLFLLNGSIRAVGGIMPKVCDYGLTPGQQAYLQARNLLLPRPMGLAAPRHPWDDKAALGRYIEDLGAAAVMWLDADLLVLTDLVPLIMQLYAEMVRDDAVLAATSADTIGEQLATDPAPGYAALVARHDPGQAYLSSGLFMCRSASFLNEWSDQTRAMPYEMLFEQNAFNLVALNYPGRVRVLDPLVWNLPAQDLRRMDISIQGQAIQVSGPHGRTIIAHATSSDRARDLSMVTMPIRAGNDRFDLSLRMFRAPDTLFAAQQRLVIDEVGAEIGLLRACGLSSGA